MDIFNKKYDLFILLVAILGGAMIFISTPYGIGVTTDSVAYLRAAAKFKETLSFNSFPTHWPPLYPLYLSFISIFFEDIIFSARISHAILFTLNIHLFSYFFQIVTGKKQALFSILAGVFFLLSPNVFNIHQMAWSEPLFISLSLGGIICLYQYFSNKTEWKFYLSAWMIGLSVITRYAGIFFIVLIPLFLFFYDRKRFGYRKSILFISVSSIPFVSLTLFNHFFQGTATNRTFIYHPATMDHFNALYAMVISWFSPFDITWVGLVSVISICAFLLIRCLNENKDHKSQFAIKKKYILFLLFLSIGYAFFIFLSISFFDAYTPIDERIFIPCFIMIFLSVFLLFSHIGKKLSVAFYIYFFILLSSNVVHTKSLIKKSSINGIGYLSRGAHNMPLVKIINKYSDNYKIYSNATDFAFMHTGKNIYGLPIVYSPDTMKKSDTFDEKINSIYKEARTGKALIVYFNSFSWRKYHQKPQKLKEDGLLDVLYFGNDGFIFGKNNE